MYCARPRDYHILGFTHIPIHPPNVTPLTNPEKVTDQGLCYCNSDAWGWLNSHQIGVTSITDRFIFKNVKKLRRVQEKNNGPKTLPCLNLNLGQRNAPFPFRMYAAIPLARGILPGKTRQGDQIREPVTPTHDAYLRLRSRRTTVYHDEMPPRLGN